ncbi:MAG: hypothetical protein J7501_17100 [Bdellovibrio sp.]|nr:hypothetical protein [Bdellovibrio sp.]
MEGSFDIEFKRKKYRLNMYGEVLELTVPTVAQFESYQAKLKNKEIDSYQTMKEHLMELGMTEAQVIALDQDDFIKLISFLSNPKKK